MASRRREEEPRKEVFARFEKTMARKVGRARERVLAGGKEVRAEVVDRHEYEYREFGDEPKIEFSPISLLILAPVLLCINISIAKREGIPTVQFLFVAFLTAFFFNLIFILRRNRLMPFLPLPADDNKLKAASLLCVVALFFCLKYGWSASGGMIFAIVWESLNGRQGCFYLIIFGAIVAGSVTMELDHPQSYLLRVIPSIVLGVAESLLQSLSKNSPYAIANQMTLFLMVGTASMYPLLEIVDITFWQYVILIVLSFSVYFNLLLLIRLMQSQRVSMVMGVMSGIIIISATEFNSLNDYVACLTITLSILVLLKIEYLDK